MIDSSKATLQGHVNFDNSDKAPVYSLESKQYTREQAVQVNLSDVTGNLISYTVTPCMTYSRLQGLSINGAMDLSKIGSGIIQLNTWRYYYNDMSIILTWGLEAYLVEGTSINEIKFNFIDLQTADQIWLHPSMLCQLKGIITEYLQRF